MQRKKYILGLVAVGVLCYGLGTHTGYRIHEGRTTDKITDGDRSIFDVKDRYRCPNPKCGAESGWG